MGSVNPSIDLAHDGEIAVVTIDNPPVNALKHEVRAGLIEAFQRVKNDAGVKAAVLACAGRTFSAGADISEFGKPRRSPGLIEVIEMIESVGKPVVAALHGTPLGGGFELALGCHYRVAAPGTRVGLPEIKLGLLPGAGGTQRLPRLIGPERALQLIVSGNPTPVEELAQDGVVDAIVPGDLRQEAIAFARKVLSERRPLTRVRDREDRLSAARADAGAFTRAADASTKRARGLRAVPACVESVRNSFEKPFDEGQARELALFMELLTSEESRAQRHIFFAEREAQKVPDMPAGSKPRDIRRGGVIGAGTMGGGIAMNFANAGVSVTLVETAPDALDRGLATIRKNYANTVSRGGLSQEEMDRRVGLITGTTDFNALADADFIIEAVFEEMGLKKRVFAELDRIAKPGAILATNTSTLDVNEIAATTKRPQDVLGTHFFSPANVMKLLEIVRGEKTAFDALATAIALGRRMAKVPVVVGVCYGFVGNRMLHLRSVEAERLILEGALPQDVDAALTEFGFPMGPFAMSDLAGIDVGWRIRKGRGERAEISDTLAEMGRFGQKTGSGYFRYEGGRTPVPDPEVEKIIIDASNRLGIQRRTIDSQEILERLIFPMINEGARILEEGIAYRPGDIDVVWVYGYGWPVWRGGPMFYADQVGLGYIGDRLAHYAARSGDKALEPAPLLARLAREGRGFAENKSEDKAA
ncbi:MAG TPA: 3-hydroxyacyl-CoA dehydrogenase NAD-binding domain-containing protein [Beijerinckiaceae bacterium]|jgi:3-hydroxyacyl-CoA dehydrogenase|nr:3-hydroxyacyl-CoA dehydrogenase NAD-binding domain-containing protein [Beijerinckiaceae bacterium]